MTHEDRARERAAKVAAIRAEEQREERRRRWRVYGSVAVVCLALVTAAAIPLSAQLRQQRAVEAAANAPIDGTEDFSAPSANHVSKPVDYPMDPPAGGDHAQAWQNCGVYREPVAAENAVHSLEHGAVWITYSPDVPAMDVQTLEGYAQREGYVLVSPYEGLDAPIVLTAWGVQLRVEGADDERIEPFLVKHVQGEQTPEPGASCSSGVGTPVR